MITPSVGGHHDQPFAIFDVDKGGRSRFTAFSPCRCQEQGPARDKTRADQSSRMTVDELMKPEVRDLQGGRGGVAQSSHFLCRCRAVTMIGKARRGLVISGYVGDWKTSAQREHTASRSHVTAVLITSPGPADRRDPPSSPGGLLLRGAPQRLVPESGRRVSNSRPQRWQRCALPTELLPHELPL
jgi:hypothetical protein